LRGPKAKDFELVQQIELKETVRKERNTRNILSKKASQAKIPAEFSFPTTLVDSPQYPVQPSPSKERELIDEAILDESGLKS